MPRIHVYTNLKCVLDLYRCQFQNLERTTRQIYLFLFGDNGFLLKVYGISGTQSVRLCLWCKTSKRQTSTQLLISLMSQNILLSTLKETTETSRSVKTEAKKKKKKAKAYDNAIHQPIFDTELSQVAPPFLHVLLGVVKKHHHLLDDECQTLDLAVANVYAHSGKTHERNTIRAMCKLPSDYPGK